MTQTRHNQECAISGNNNNTSAPTAPSTSNSTSNTNVNQSKRTGKGGKNGYRPGRNNNSTQGNKQGKSGDSTGAKPTNAFRGAVKEMNGHVFQVYGEAVHKNQFTRTLDALAGYIGLNLKYYPADIKRMVTTLTETYIEKPINPPDEPTKFEMRLWGKDVDLYATQLRAYKSNKCALHSLVWGQCFESMQSKIKSYPEFEAMSNSNDSLELLRTIKGISLIQVRNTRQHLYCA